MTDKKRRKSIQRRHQKRSPKPLGSAPCQVKVERLKIPKNIIERHMNETTVDPSGAAHRFEFEVDSEKFFIMAGSPTKEEENAPKRLDASKSVFEFKKPVVKLRRRKELDYLASFLPVQSLQCLFCDITMTSEEKLYRHVSNCHLFGYSNRCNLCGYTVNKPWNILKGHVFPVHFQIGLLGCSLCRERFALEADIERHILDIHDNLATAISYVSESEYPPTQLALTLAMNKNSTDTKSFIL